MNIVLTSNLETIIDDKHQFVTIGPNCWGVGGSAKEALKNCKTNAPYGYRGHFLTRVAPKEGFQIDPVDGTVTWEAKHDAKACQICSVGKGILVSVK